MKWDIGGLARIESKPQVKFPMNDSDKKVSHKNRIQKGAKWRQKSRLLQSGRFRHQ